MSSKKNIKEKYLNDAIEPISIDILKIIIEQTEKSIYKIKCKNGENGTGFFCLIPFPDKLNVLPVLITNNHVLNITEGKKIIFTMNNDKISKHITIDESRKTYTNEKYDITIIEMKKSDNMNFNTFLEIDENIFTDNPNDFYRHKSIYLIYYPIGNKADYSNGLIKDIDKYLDFYNVNHLCQTKKGASGCPIINLNNNRVLAIHKGADKENDWNLGTFIKQPIEKFYEKYNNRLINKECKKENNYENNFNEIKNVYKSINYDIGILGEDEPNYDLTFKVIMIGKSGKKFFIIFLTLFKYIGVGKSCLALQAIENKFEDNLPTIGFEFHSYNVKYKNKVINLKIWDTCGQEMYSFLATNYYRNSSLAIIIYAIDE